MASANSVQMDIIVRAIDQTKGTFQSIGREMKNLNVPSASKASQQYNQLMKDVSQLENKLKSLAGTDISNKDLMSMTKDVNSLNTGIEKLASSTQSIRFDAAVNQLKQLETATQNVGSAVSSKMTAAFKEAGRTDVTSTLQKGLDNLTNSAKNLDFKNLTNLSSQTKIVEKDFENMSNKVQSEITRIEKAQAKTLASGKEVSPQSAANLSMYKNIQQMLDVERQKFRENTAAARELNQAIAQGAGSAGIAKATHQFDALKHSIDNSKLAIKDTTSQMTNFTTGLSKINDIKAQTSSLVSSFLSVSTVLTTITSKIYDTFNTVKELDKSMTEQAVVTTSTVGDLWGQLPEYTKNAIELGVATKDVYDATTLYVQQGLDAQTSLGVGIETLKMARVAGMEAAKATDAMTAALRGFNLESNQANAQKINDVYSKIAAETASNVAELSTAMEKTASLANASGMDVETTTGFLAQMIETTREAPENLGTALKTIIARFQNIKDNPLEVITDDSGSYSYNKVDEALQSIGVSLKEDNGDFRNFGDVILDISKKWNTLSQAQQKYIATQAAGSRQQSRFIALVGNNDRLQEILGSAYDSAGAGEQQYEKTLDSLESKLQQLKNSYDNFAMSIMNQDIIKTAVDTATGLLTVLNKIVDFGGSLGSIFGDTGESIGKTVTAVTLFITGLKGLSALLPSIKDGLTGFFSFLTTGFKPVKPKETFSNIKNSFFGKDLFTVNEATAKKEASVSAKKVSGFYKTALQQNKVGTLDGKDFSSFDFYKRIQDNINKNQGKKITLDVFDGVKLDVNSLNAEGLKALSDLEEDLKKKSIELIKQSENEQLKNITGNFAKQAANGDKQAAYQTLKADLMNKFGTVGEEKSPLINVVRQFQQDKETISQTLDDIKQTVQAKVRSINESPIIGYGKEEAKFSGIKDIAQNLEEPLNKLKQMKGVAEEDIQAIEQAFNKGDFDGFQEKLNEAFNKAEAAITENTKLPNEIQIIVDKIETALNSAGTGAQINLQPLIAELEAEISTFAEQSEGAATEEGKQIGQNIIDGVKARLSQGNVGGAIDFMKQQLGSSVSGQSFDPKVATNITTAQDNINKYSQGLNTTVMAASMAAGAIATLVSNLGDVGPAFSGAAGGIGAGLTAFSSLAMIIPQIGTALSGLEGVFGTIGTALTGPIGIGVTAAIAGIVAIVTAVHKYKEEVRKQNIEAAKDVQDTWTKASEKVQKNLDTINSVKNDYDNLSQGVDVNTNQNLSLGTEDYQKYLDTVNKIAETSPELVKGYDSQGNAILEAGAAAEAAAVQQRELAKAQKEYLKEASGQKLLQGAISTEEQDKDQSKRLKNVEGLTTTGIQTLTDLSTNGVNTSKYYENTKNTYSKMLDLDKDYRKAVAEAEAKYQKDTSNTAAKATLDRLTTAQSENSKAIEQYKKDYADYTSWAQKYAEQNAKDLNVQGNGVALSKNAAEEIALTSNSAEEATTTINQYNEEMAKLQSGSEGAAKSLGDPQKKIDKLKEQLNDGKITIDQYRDKVKEISDAWDGVDLGKNATEGAKKALEDYTNALDKAASAPPISVDEVFNPLAGNIKSAEGMADNLSKQVTSDFYTAAKSVSSTLDTVLSKENTAGYGSKTFWAGSTDLLGEKAISDAKGNIDKVKKQLNSLKTAFKPGEEGAKAFTELLVKNRKKLEKYKMEGAIAGIETDANGNFKFENLDLTKLDKIAETLQVSKEAAAAMFNNLAQFTKGTYTNVAKLNDALTANKMGIQGKEEGTLIDKGGLKGMAMSAGLTEDEWKHTAKQLKDNNVYTVDTTKDAKVQANQLYEAMSKLKIGDSTAKAIDSSALIKTMYQLGESQDNARAILTEMQTKGQLSEKVDDDTLAEAWKNLEASNGEEIADESLNVQQGILAGVESIQALLGKDVTAGEADKLDEKSAEIRKDAASDLNKSTSKDLSGLSLKQLDAQKSSLSSNKKELENTSAKLAEQRKREEEALADAKAGGHADKDQLQKYEDNIDKLKSEKEAVDKLVDSYDKQSEAINKAIESKKESKKLDEVNLSNKTSMQDVASKTGIDSKVQTKLKKEFNVDSLSDIKTYDATVGKKGKTIPVKLQTTLEAKDSKEVLNLLKDNGKLEKNATVSIKESDDGSKIAKILGKDGETHTFKINADTSSLEEIKSKYQTYKTQIEGNSIKIKTEVSKKDSDEVLNTLKNKSLLKGAQSISISVKGDKKIVEVLGQGNKKKTYEVDVKGNVKDLDDKLDKTAKKPRTAKIETEEVGKDGTNKKKGNKIETEEVRKGGTNKKKGDKKETITVTVKADTSKFKSQIKKAAKTPTKVKVSANTTSAKKSIKSLSKNTKSKVKVSANTSSAKGSIKKLSSTKVKLNATANTSKAAASIKKLSNIKPRVKVGADVSSAKNSINALDGKRIDIDVYYTEHNKPKGKNAAGNASYSDIYGSYNTFDAFSEFNSFAKGNQHIRGTGNKRGGLTLTGELGPEIAWFPSRGTARLLGQNGPELTYLPKDAVVFNNQDSKKIAKRGGINKDIGSLSGGTAKGRGGPSWEASNKSSSGRKRKSSNLSGTEPKAQAKTKTKTKSKTKSKTETKGKNSNYKLHLWVYNIEKKITHEQELQNRLTEKQNQLLQYHQGSLEQVLANYKKQKSEVQKELELQQKLADYYNKKLKTLDKTGKIAIKHKKTSKSKKDTTKKINAGKYITKDKNGAYTIDYKKINKEIKNGNERKALEEKLKSKLDDYTQGYDSAQGAAESLQTKLFELSKAMKDAIPENIFSRLVRLQKQIDQTTTKLNRANNILSILQRGHSVDGIASNIQNLRSVFGSTFSSMSQIITKSQKEYAQANKKMQDNLQETLFERKETETTTKKVTKKTNYQKGKEAKNTLLNNSKKLKLTKKQKSQVKQGKKITLTKSQKKILKNNAELNREYNAYNKYRSSYNKGQEKIKKANAAVTKAKSSKTYTFAKKSLNNAKNVIKKDKSLKNKKAIKEAMKDNKKISTKGITNKTDLKEIKAYNKSVDKYNKANKKVRNAKTKANETKKNVTKKTTTTTKKTTTSKNREFKLGDYIEYDNNGNIQWTTDTNGKFKWQNDRDNKVLNAEDVNVLKDQYSELESLQDTFNQYRDEILTQLSSMYDAIDNNISNDADLAQQLIDAQTTEEQNTIDSLSAINDAINDANDNIIQRMQYQINLQRNQRDNAKTEKDIQDKLNRLAFLQQDGSASNASKIASLQKEIIDAQDNYGDNLVDQEIERIQHQMDEAKAQRERQITLLEGIKDSVVNTIAKVETADNLIRQLQSGNIQAAINAKDAITKIISDSWNNASTSYFQKLDNLRTLNETMNKAAESDGSLNSYIINGDSIGSAIAKTIMEHPESGTAAQYRTSTGHLNDEAKNQIEADVNSGTMTAEEQQAWKDKAASGTLSESDQKIVDDVISSINKANINQLSYNAQMGKLTYDVIKSQGITKAALDAQNISLSTLRNTDKLTAKQAEELGYNVSALQSAGYSKNDIISSGASISALKAGGYSAKEINQAYSWTDILKATNSKGNKLYSLKDLKKWAGESDLQKAIAGTKTAKDTVDAFASLGLISPGSKGIKNAATLLKRAEGISGAQLIKALASSSTYKWTDIIQSREWKDDRLVATFKNNNAFVAAFKKIRGKKAYNKAKKAKASKYLHGGFADYTGPAWLDGSKARPEAVLSATDTKNFVQLRDVLSSVSKGAGSNTTTYGDIHYNIEMNVDRIEKDVDVNKLTNDIMRNISKKAGYRNINAIRNMK